MLSQTRSTRTMAGTHNVLVWATRYAEANDRVGRNVASFVRPPQGKTGRPSRAMTRKPFTYDHQDGPALPAWLVPPGSDGSG